MNGHHIKIWDTVKAVLRRIFLNLFFFLLRRIFKALKAYVRKERSKVSNLNFNLKKLKKEKNLKQASKQIINVEISVLKNTKTIDKNQ